MYLFILFMVHLMHWLSNIFANGTVLLATTNGSTFKLATLRDSQRLTRDTISFQQELLNTYLLHTTNV